ncbi:MAG: pyruvate formate lyase family protein [Armatimonadota bacterium]
MGSNITVAGVPATRQGILRGSTPRTHRLAVDAATRAYVGFGEQERLYQAYQPPPGVTTVMEEALRYCAVHPHLTPFIREDELLVGARLREQAAGTWGWSPDGSVDYVAYFATLAPRDNPEIQAMAERGVISPQGSFNHKVVDYAGFIRTGSAALAQRAREIAETKTGEERDFALAFAMGHEAMIDHAQTYARACRELADTSSPERTAELREIARICEKVPAQPAETFHEALQSLWFAYMTAGDATGRIDAYLYDFYQADLAAGRITPERALELIECLLIKLHGDVMAGMVNVSSVQTMTLGGVLPDGSDATNDLTRLFLQAARNVRLLRPTIYIRCHEGTPEDVLELAVTMLGEGLAEPSFYGDTPIIAGLTRLGVPVDVARDYALSGCTEVVSPGRGNWGAPNGWINLALVVDEALRAVLEGEPPGEPRTSELLSSSHQGYARGIASDIPGSHGHGSPGGSPSKDDREPFVQGIWPAIERHIEKVAEACRVANIWVDEQRKDALFNATMLMPVCLEKCRDIVHGGAESYFGHWEAMGLPNAAEMVYAAEQLANDTSLPDLYARLDAGDPALFAQLNRLPKFGNDAAEVDDIGARLITLLADALERRGTPLRTKLVLGHLAGAENMHMAYGARMGATLDGRRAGQPLADSLAGKHGCTKSGPTALLRSLCRLDHSRLIAGNVSTLRLSTHDFATPADRANVTALIRTFVAMGGSQLQINVADAATLRAAQAHPEEHAGLMVRVAGYSSDFTLLGKPVQDEIIARTEGLE